MRMTSALMVLFLFGCKVTVGDDKSEPSQTQEPEGSSDATTGTDSTEEESGAEESTENPSDPNSPSPEEIVKVENDEKVVEEIKNQVPASSPNTANKITEVEQELDIVKDEVVNDRGDIRITEAKLAFCAKVAELIVLIEEERDNSLLTNVLADRFIAELEALELCSAI